MSKQASEARFGRPFQPAYKRNIQPFAGSAASGKCVDPTAQEVALDNVKKVRKDKEDERKRKDKEVEDAAAEVLAAYNKERKL